MKQKRRAEHLLFWLCGQVHLSRWSLRQAGLHERQSCEYSAVGVTQGPTLAYSTHARQVDSSGITCWRCSTLGSLMLRPFSPFTLRLGSHSSTGVHTKRDNTLKQRGRAVRAQLRQNTSVRKFVTPHRQNCHSHNIFRAGKKIKPHQNASASKQTMSRVIGVLPFPSQSRQHPNQSFHWNNWYQKGTRPTQSLPNDTVFNQSIFSAWVICCVTNNLQVNEIFNKLTKWKKK